MKFDIVVAGLRGQGNATVARVLTTAAQAGGLHVVQSEPIEREGREGALSIQLRLSDEPLSFTAIGPQEADLVLALDPGEGLAQRDLLSPGGTLLAASDSAGGSAAEELRWSILLLPSGYLVEAGRLSREVGSERLAGLVLVGAATDFVPMDPAVLRLAVEITFRARGDAVMRANVAAFEAGRASLRHRELVDEFDTFSSFAGR